MGPNHPEVVKNRAEELRETMFVAQEVKKVTDDDAGELVVAVLNWVLEGDSNPVTFLQGEDLLSGEIP